MLQKIIPATTLGVKWWWA